MRIITLKFANRCTETRQYLKAGDVVLYNPSSKKVWSQKSSKYQKFISKTNKKLIV